MASFSDDAFLEEPLFRSVSTRFAGEEGFEDNEFGARKKFGFDPFSMPSSFSRLDKPGLSFLKAVDSVSHSGPSHDSTHEVPASKDFFSSSRASAPLQLPFSNEFAYERQHAEVAPPMLFNGYYDKYSSFLSHTEPSLLLDSLRLVFEKLGCDCRSIPGEAKIEATHFLDFSMLAFDASVFTKDKSHDLFLVEISRRSGDGVKFSRFYAEAFSLLRDTCPDLIDMQSMLQFESSSAEEGSGTPSATAQDQDSQPQRPTHSKTTSHKESATEEEISPQSESPESCLDSSALPARPDLRRSPSSSRAGVREEAAPPGVPPGVPTASALLLAEHDAHPLGPIKLSRDLFNSLLAFCRSDYLEQQRDGLELLARLASHPVNRRALPRFARELLAAVSSLLPSADLGVQHSACALLAQVLAATRCDTKALFAAAASRGHSRAAPSEPRPSEKEGAAAPKLAAPSDEDSDSAAPSPAPLNARSLFSNVSDLLFAQSRHVRTVASEVLNCVATQSAEPELVKSPLYLTWLRQQLAAPDAGVGHHARAILARLGSL